MQTADASCVNWASLPVHPLVEHVSDERGTFTDRHLGDEESAVRLAHIHPLLDDALLPPHLNSTTQQNLSSMQTCVSRLGRP